MERTDIRREHHSVWHSAVSWRATPNQHIRAEVSAVGPDDGAVFDADGSEVLVAVADEIEDRTIEQRRDVALDRRTVRQRQAEAKSIERRHRGDSFQLRHHDI